MYSCNTFFSSVKNRRSQRDLRFYLLSMALYNFPERTKSPCICDAVSTRVEGEMYIPDEKKPAVLFICRTHQKYAPLAEQSGSGLHS